MAGAKLSQSEIDALLASMNDNEGAQESSVDDGPAAFDFRRPAKFTRDHMRSMETAHEVLARRLTGVWTQTLRAVVTLEPVSTDQITYQDYTRSIPSPSVLTTFSLNPLPGPVVIEMSAQMGLTLIDRLLGGLGSPVAMRRPTELESGLLNDLMERLVLPLQEALEPLEDVTPAIEAIEFNPQFVQAVPPNEMVLMFTFQLSLASTVRSEGLMTLCYPFSTLAPAMDKLQLHAWHSPGDRHSDNELEPPRPFRKLLPEVPVPVTVRLKDSDVPAFDLAMLRPGDVLRLEHRVDEPAMVNIGDEHVLSGRIGRSGRRLAFQVASWDRGGT